jgi:ABC-type phosphate/phosphonate transport system substrate-binding protein
MRTGDNAMTLSENSLRQFTLRFLFPTFASALFLAAVGTRAGSAEEALNVLRIGTTGELTGRPSGPREKAGLETLHKYIKDEDGMDNEILRQKDWQELADRMAKGKLQLGVFQGCEFAWAQQSDPKLKPLAIAVNVNRYPAAHLVVKNDNAAKDFTGLQGQSLALPITGESFLRLFVDRQSEAAGKNAETFFSKITTPDNVEDALDSLVDGKVQAVVVDRAALEAYKGRKPGRFKQLKEVAHSQPFPPVVVAYYGSVLDEGTREQFKTGMMSATNNEKGQTLLTLFHLTGFETVPQDFEKVLAAIVKEYPPQKDKEK